MNDPNSNKPSVTTTMFVIGFIVATIKLLISGLSIGGFKASDFTGVDYGAAIAALGGIYTIHKQRMFKDDNDDKKDQ